MMTASPALAGNEVAMEEVPPNIRESATGIAPDLKIDRVEIEEEDGALVYEFQGKGPKGYRIEIDIAPDGALEEIEMEMPASALPPAVCERIEKQFPNLKISYAETSVRPDGAFVYEVEGITEEGDALALDIAEDGELLGVEGAASS